MTSCPRGFGCVSVAAAAEAEGLPLLGLPLPRGGHNAQVSQLVQRRGPSTSLFLSICLACRITLVLLQPLHTRVLHTRHILMSLVEEKARQTSQRVSRLVCSMRQSKHDDGGDGDNDALFRLATDGAACFSSVSCRGKRVACSGQKCEPT